MTAPATSIREYQVRAETTRTFGRVLAGARDHHLVVDGPVQNGCPGEAITPVELFLAAVASCGAELVQVIAREEGVPLDAVAVTMTGTVDRSRQPRTGKYGVAASPVASRSRSGVLQAGRVGSEVRLGRGCHGGS